MNAFGDVRDREAVARKAGPGRHEAEGPLLVMCAAHAVVRHAVDDGFSHAGHCVLGIEDLAVDLVRVLDGGPPTGHDRAERPTATMLRIQSS